MSEEAWLWYGFGLYAQRRYDGALKAWQKADKINPNFFEDQHRKQLSDSITDVTQPSMIPLTAAKGL